LKRLIELSSEKGIKMMIILPPKIKDRYDYFMPAFNMLPKSNIIDLADPELFGDFYEKNLSYDEGHFMQEGARIYTERLVEAFLRLGN
jgi:hypothetical protein